MELAYQYCRLNSIVWREEFREHPSLWRKKLQKLIEQSKRNGRPWVVTKSALDEVKLTLCERWQAWSEDGVTLTTKYDELESKMAQSLNQYWEILQNDRPSKSK
jgi:hypothetical protein